MLTITPTFQPGDHVITTTRGPGVVHSQHGVAIFVRTTYGLVVTHAHTTRHDPRS